MEQNNELKHYGVLGMKWGVRRGKAAKAYAKAGKKLEKIDKKYEKKLAKAMKKSANADRLLSKRNPWAKGKGQREEIRAKKEAAKVSRYAQQGTKWVKSMEKAFMNTDITLTSEHRSMGEKYSETLNRRAMNRYL